MGADADASPVFEVERFELADGERLEVAGRWFGVRGVRFMRPSLIVRSDDGERSILATLEHKPWAAEDGSQWIAAFPWRGGPVDARSAELAVAPSIVVPLAPEPKGAGKKAAARRPTLRDRLDNEEQRARRLEAEVAWLREERERLLARTDAAESAAAAAEATASGRAAALEQRDGAEQARAAAVEEREGAERARAEAERHRDELDEARAAATRGRDELRRERDAMVGERDELKRRVTAAERERDAALAEREAASEDERGKIELREERNIAARERDEALRRLSRAYRELDAATKERDAALGERDRAIERAEEVAGTTVADAPEHAAWRGDALAARKQRLNHARNNVDWLARTIAVVGVLCLLLLLVGLFRLV